MRTHFKSAPRDQKGSALLMVLWLTAALAAIGLTVASSVRGETERTQTSVDDARSYFEARGGIERAALHIMWRRIYGRPDGDQIYYEPGMPTMELAFPSAAVHVDIIPETSKLNLNNAPPEELLRLLIALGTPEDRAATITAAIVDWRTPANPRNASIFDSFYLSQSPSFLPRHASFMENEELLLVQGMTAELYYGASLGGTQAGLRDCISVYGTTGAVDINTAQPATLEAIGLSPADARAIVERRNERPITGEELAGIAQPLAPAGNRLRIGGQTMFTLRATARMRQPDGKLSDLRRTVGALVKFRPAGFEIVRWYDRI
jgi:general secretion pathway protein K